jgi:hypothetical protein
LTNTLSVWPAIVAVRVRAHVAVEVDHALRIEHGVSVVLVTACSISEPIAGKSSPGSCPAGAGSR